MEKGAKCSLPGSLPYYFIAPFKKGKDLLDQKMYSNTTKIQNVIIGDGLIGKFVLSITVVCILFTCLLAGCIQGDNHRVIVTIANNRDISQRIQLHIDGSLKFTEEIGPWASIEREYEFQPGEYTFELYQEVSGTFELYKTETIDLESDSSILFELE